MDFTTLTIDILKMLSVVGGYGIGIILLTIIIRAAMWPLGVSQQRSMRTMQLLQPKMKAIQERYKSDPQKMQQKMMEFYKEHKFNPMGGCLPLLIQMPIFILLYSALISPQFIQVAGDQHFLFIKSLATTMRATAGISDNGVLGVAKDDQFVLGNTATIYLPNEKLSNVKVVDPAKAIEIQGEMEPGKDLEMIVSLNHFKLKFSELNKIEKADLVVTNNNIRENETITFVRDGNADDGILRATVPTIAVNKTLHWDVLLLIALFAVTMFASQKIMMATNKSDSMDPTQQALQKSMGTFMPIMIIATFVIIPIPAGVLLYLVTSNLIQIAQTVIVNKQLDMEDAKKTEKIDPVDLSNAKKIQPKSITDDK